MMYPQPLSEESLKLFEQVEALVEVGDAETLQSILRESDPVEIAAAIRRLTGEQSLAMWKIVHEHAPELAAPMLDHFNDLDIALLLSRLNQADSNELLSQMASARRREVIGILSESLKQKVLKSLPDFWGKEERSALHYPHESAGGICMNEIIKLPENATGADLKNALAEYEDYLEFIEWRYIYLHDEGGGYLGGVNTRDLLLLNESQLLREYLDDSIPTVEPVLSLGELKSTFDATLHPVLPVVNHNGLQIGIVGLRDINLALYHKSEQQLLESSGIFGGDEFRSMSLMSRNVRRLAFLLPSVALSYAAVSIISMYEPIIEQLAVLAAILPLVANLSGAAGNQAVAVSIRELSLEHISSKDFFYVILKEIPIGLINGIAIGSVIAGLTILAHGDEGLLLPLIIGLAYSVSSVLAVIIGGSLPLLMKRFNLDPAMLSSPILTTLTDAISFFFVLYLAQMLLL